MSRTAAADTHTHVKLKSAKSQSKSGYENKIERETEEKQSVKQTKKNKQTTHKKVVKFKVMFRNSVNKLNIYLQNTQVLQLIFLSLVLLLLKCTWYVGFDWNSLSFKLINNDKS